jgi:hypothetical protein
MDDDQTEADAPAREAAPEAPPAASHPAEAVFAAWVLEKIHNSPLSRAREGIDHLINDALPDLLRRLKQEL